MLLQRILTATVLAALAITAIFTLPTLFFYLFIALIILLAAWEWTGLIGIDKIIAKLGFLLLLIVPMLAVTFFTQILEVLSTLLDNPELKKQSGALEWLVIAPVIFWVFMTFAIKRAADELLKLKLKKSSKVFLAWFLLLSAWMFLTKLRAYYGVEAVMYFLALIWIADISAFFSGKIFGKDKLAPVISPGKTVQGLYGALFSALLCSIALALYYGFPLMIATDFAMLSLLTVLISIYGDLFFSLVKRQAGVKDSGTLLPGHGGVLDRIDSVIAAAPFYYAGIILIGRSVYS
ncbi:MAG: phosphatidate cytidylyltransferase [Methylococcales symbiont of Iophon sp. n. MRB-2018]|nr:MAG: phosphatidate cytidylyltransferase [Methylococcales symbiont of Iophon sp. n. MRB-2018]KAF3980539.1 MAG: phosphatidate cytidylyltransferase [Methylococcales symbiont of Iophon sp. n. MRB-2018]